MPYLNALRGQFVRRLQSSIEQNLKLYRKEKTWIERFAGNRDWEFATPCKIEGSFNLTLPDDDDLYDLENAIRLHRALPGLTPVQAQDPRLWTRLTHLELWKYMRARWPVERYSEKDKKIVVGRVLEQYFVPQRQSRALIRNGAARLWWAAKLTFDPKRKNPYELTSVLLHSLDIAKNLLERSFGRSPRVTRTFLDYVLRHKNECLREGNRSRLLVRHLTKSLNFHGGICVLDCMTKRDIVAFLNEQKERFESDGELAAATAEEED